MLYFWQALFQIDSSGLSGKGFCQYDGIYAQHDENARNIVSGKMSVML